MREAMTVEAGSPPELGAGRRRRKTLAPGELRGLKEISAVGGASCFDVLVEDAVTDSSYDESCDSDVPYNVAMDVVGSPRAPEWSTLVRRGNISDEEMVADFWSELGYPTQASRVWESPSRTASAGTLSSRSCRAEEVPCGEERRRLLRC
jgi:hypothetical protein